MTEQEVTDIVEAFDPDKPIDRVDVQAKAGELLKALGLQAQRFTWIDGLLDANKPANASYSWHPKTRLPEVWENYAHRGIPESIQRIHGFLFTHDWRDQTMTAPTTLWAVGNKQFIKPDNDEGIAPALQAVRTKIQQACWELAQTNIGGIAFEKGVCILSTPPKTLWNDRKQLHCMTGPALKWGTKEVYAINGVVVEEAWVKNPEKITAIQILQHNNAEQRRVMMDLYGGFDRMVVDTQARLVDESKYGKLYRITYDGVRMAWGRAVRRRSWNRSSTNFKNHLTLLKVVNATAEPDGSFREFVLPVPNTCNSARAAVAFTFGKRVRDYNPQQES
jgi:uncharacterized protein DUF6745